MLKLQVVCCWPFEGRWCHLQDSKWMQWSLCWWDWKTYAREKQLTLTQTSIISEFYGHKTWQNNWLKHRRPQFSGYACKSGHCLLWNREKFSDYDPHYYTCTCRVKEVNHTRLNPYSNKMDSGIEIPEVWMPPSQLFKTEQSQLSTMFHKVTCIQ